MVAGFPGVNSEFQELVKACAEAALETNDSELQTKVILHQNHAADSALHFEAHHAHDVSAFISRCAADALSCVASACCTVGKLLHACQVGGWPLSVSSVLHVSTSVHATCERIGCSQKKGGKHHVQHLKWSQHFQSLHLHSLVASTAHCSAHSPHLCTSYRQIS